MATTKITLDDGRECRITLSGSIQGTRAHSIMFAPDSSDIESETHDTLYVDYCHEEIVYLEVGKLTEGLIDAYDVWNDLELQGIFSCSCDYDSGE